MHYTARAAYIRLYALRRYMRRYMAPLGVARWKEMQPHALICHAADAGARKDSEMGWHVLALSPAP